MLGRGSQRGFSNLYYVKVKKNKKDTWCHVIMAVGKKFSNWGKSGGPRCLLTHMLYSNLVNVFFR